MLLQSQKFSEGVCLHCAKCEGCSSNHGGLIIYFLPEWPPSGGMKMAKKKNGVVPLRLSSADRSETRRQGPNSYQGHALDEDGAALWRLLHSRLEREGDGHAHRPGETGSQVACVEGRGRSGARRQTLNKPTPLEFHKNFARVVYKQPALRILAPPPARWLREKTSASS